MANEEPQKEKRQKNQGAVAIAPFGIEADHPRNADLLLQSIPGCRLRSTVLATRQVIDRVSGEPRIPVDQSRHLGTFPPIPGMQLHINPANCKYTVLDPLTKDDQLLERLEKRLKETSMHNSGGKLRGVPTLEGQLDIHRMKTLCREIINLVRAGEAKVIQGTLPSLEDLEDLPGNFLLNPGCQVPNTQPIFEKDWDSWVAQLTRSGG